MHRPTLLSILLALVLSISGCLGILEGDEEPEPQDNGTGEDENDGPDGNNTTEPPGNETELHATIGSFSSDIKEGTAPANVTFTWQVDTNDEEATWELDLGDGTLQEGAVADDSDSLLHSYAEEGNYTATFTVNYGDGETVQNSLNLSFESGTQLPEQWTFEYGLSLGCIGDFATCISRELGPGGEEIDGFWQELDSRYWGLGFTVNADSALGDTDCQAYDENEEPIEADLNGGGGPCEGSLPEGTKWLFLYSYAEPALSLELVFSQPE